MTRRTVGLALFLSASLFYWFHTGQETFWLDSAEFNAMASAAGIPHPPGTPLYVLLCSVVARTLPIGNVALRVHLLNCLLGGLCAFLVYRLAVKLGGVPSAGGGSIGAGGVPSAGGGSSGAGGCWARRVEVVVGAVVAGAFALSPAIWFQSIRAEVYSLNTAITTGMVLLALEAGERAPHGQSARGPLLLLALLGGLGLANHHFLTALTGACCLVYLLVNSGTRLPLLRALPLAAAFGLAGFAVYLYLPLRSLDGWKMWGDPTTLSGFKAILSAEAFHISVTEMPKAPFLVAWFMILEKWIDLLGFPLFLAGIAGLCILLARKRAEGLLVALLIFAGGASKAIMYLDLDNPDDHAYFLVGLTALAAAAGGLLLQVRGPLLCRLVPAVALLAGLASAAMLFAANRTTCDLSRFSGPDFLNRHFQERAPPDALLMPSYYPVHFNHLFFREVEKRRPDLLYAHQSLYSRFQGGRPYCQDLVRQSPELAPVTEEYLSTGGFPVRSLRELSKHREVLLENDTMRVSADDPRLAPFSLGDSGLPVDARELTYEGPGVLLAPAAGREVEETTSQRSFWTGFYRDLEGSGGLHPELAKLLVWFHYRNALLFVNKKVWRNALLEVRMARRLEPDEQRLLDLEILLEGAL
ncbi:MAG: DUF2723 domain-containing protein [Deltaproteobacteria bacterium]|nr:DUF2723 domain-containing protein [Deltaproteobacteria bacterium]